MWQLIKQIFFSFKKTWLLLVGLLFLTTTSVFIAVSAIYATSNISNSINRVQELENSSNHIIQPNLNTPASTFKYSTNSSITKNIIVSAYNLNTTNIKNNTIHPYLKSDFNNFAVSNATQTAGEEFANFRKAFSGNPSKLVRIQNRKSGIIKANGISDLDQKSSGKVMKWNATSFSLVDLDTDAIMMNPMYLTFNSENGKIDVDGYFVDGFINEQINVNESISQVTSDPIFPEELYKSLLKPNKPFLALHWNLPIQVNLNAESFQDQHIHHKDLIWALESNTRIENDVKHYPISIDINSMNGIEKFIYDSLQKDFQMGLNLNLKKLFYSDFPIRKVWIDEYLKTNADSSESDAITAFLESQTSQMQTRWYDFVNENKEKYFKNFLQQNLNLKIQDSKSFIYQDKESLVNYLLVKKESENLNPIFMDQGTDLIDSQDSLNEIEKLAGNYFVKPTEKQRIEWSESYARYLLSGAFVSSQGLESKTKFMKDVASKFLEERANNVIRSDLIKILSLYFQPRVYQDSFQNIRSAIVINGGTSTINQRTDFSNFQPDNYRAVVTNKYLTENNKKILPEKSSDANDKLSWEYASTLTRSSFDDWFNNVVPNQYKLRIGEKSLLISGTGISSEYMFPTAELTRPIPSTSTDVLVYLNEAAYNEILTISPASFQNPMYFFDFDLQSLTVEELNNILVPIFGRENSSMVFNIQEMGLDNINFMRFFFPSLINDLITIFSLVAALIFILLSIYLTYLILKNIIDKFKIQLAIVRANGFSIFSITNALSIIALLISVFGGTIGYVVSYFLQSSFFNILSPYIFFTVVLNGFNPFYLLVIIPALFLLFYFFTWINVKLLFKRPLNVLVSETVEVKPNKFLNLMKNIGKSEKVSNSYLLKASTKFKISLSLINIRRVIFYVFALVFGTSLMAISLSFTGKFEDSLASTNANKNYTYALDLVTPNEQAGLYKMQQYIDVGKTEPEKGIYSLYPEIANEDRPYARTELLIRNLDGSAKLDENGNQQYFANILLPSWQIYNEFNSNPDVYRNAVFSKWLLDFELPKIGVVPLGINVWNLIGSQLPPEISSQIEKNSQEFLEAILESEERLGTPELANRFKTFLKQDLYEQGIYKLDGELIMNKITGDLNKSKFNSEFIEFIGMVYGVDWLSEMDVKMSFGLVNVEKDVNESYTYVQTKLNREGIKEEDSNIKIMGINPNSQFINLKDNDLNFIGNLLDSKPNAVIVNNGAVLKYGLKVGDQINVDILNTYDRYSRKMLGIDKTKNQTLEVVGISSTSFDEEFYISQTLANKLIGLDRGHLVADLVPVSSTLKTNKGFETIRMNSLPKDYVPFNGIFSTAQTPNQISRSLSFNVNFNMYGDFFNFANSQKTSILLDAQYNQFITEAITPFDSVLIDELNQKNGTNLTRETLKTEIMNLFVEPASTKKFLQDVFGITPFSPNLQFLDTFAVMQNLYSTITGTLTATEGALMMIVIPTIVILILIMSWVMLSEIKQMIAVLKTLGYSDRQNVGSIIFVFLPVLVISLLVSLGVIAVVSLGMQFFIYQGLSIFVSSRINFINYFLASLMTLAILMTAIIFSVILYKRMKLRDVIKN